MSAGLLVRLDLADNTLGEEGGQVLAEALSSQPSLTYVNLRDCELGVSTFLSFVLLLFGCCCLSSCERTVRRGDVCR